ncbi:glucosyltransferase domain-containing protein [Escherichia coli]|uniref:glucosyltransferase domain-containing protein n=1 Tax=Escherichia coli TaxID=562 RepID=UPI001F0EF9BA|nr:glucosyltransferase domain-containing protein [Escherichia coli]MCH4635433.1 glucosyltransferase domain-containing protein [Escherichia coli]
MITSFLDKNKWLLSLAILYVLPIIIANAYYIDDMGRVLSGYGWHEDGRIFATYIMQIMSFGSLISQMAPLSTILSALIMFVAGYLLSTYLFEGDKLLIKACSLLLLTSPFFLENISYKYDSIPMSLSVLLAITPYIARNKVSFFIFSATCLTLVFGLYQTSAMAYFAVLACFMVKDLSISSIIKNIPTAIISIASFLLSYAIYSFLVKYIGIQLSRGELINLDSNSLIEIKSRVIRYYYFYDALLSSGYIYAVSPLIACVLISFFKDIMNGFFRAVSLFVMFIILILSLLILTTLPNLVISDPWYTSRTMICYPFLLFAVVAYCKSRFDNKVIAICVSIVIFYSFILSNSLGSVLKNNDEYNDFISRNISNEIMKDNDYDLYKVVIVGQSKRAIRSELQYQAFPIIDKLAPNYMSEGWYWGIRSLSKYLTMEFVRNRDEVSANVCNYKLLNKTSLYSIRSEKDLFIIDFKDNCK